MQSMMTTVHGRSRVNFAKLKSLKYDCHNESDVNVTFSGSSSTHNTDHIDKACYQYICRIIIAPK